jgi:hypothetical protein
MRNTIETVPKDGQFVIVEDASGNDDVARWAAESDTWVGLDGEPIGIRPTHWWPMPAASVPPPSAPPPPPPGFAFPQLKALARRPVSAGRGDGQSNVLPLRGRPADGAPLRRSFPLFSVLLFGIVVSGVGMASIGRDDPMRDLRDALVWLRSFDSMSAAAQPPLVQRATDVAAAVEPQRPIDAEALPDASADRRAAEGKPEQPAVLTAARQSEPLEQNREQARTASGDVVTTGGVVNLGRSAADEASQAQLARSIVTARAPDAQAALHEPAKREPEAAAESSELLERATQLLRRGDVAAARLVLAFAHETGSARAGFLLAETYDPHILSTWRVLGTRADAGKARELYGKAYAGGIAEAKARSDALSE